MATILVGTQYYHIPSIRNENAVSAASTMTQARLNHTFITFIHEEHTDGVNEQDIVKIFIPANDRKRKYFRKIW